MQSRSGTILAKKLDDFDALARKKDEPVQPKNTRNEEIVPE
jgi:hypothetical protein